MRTSDRATRGAGLALAVLTAAFVLTLPNAQPAQAALIEQTNGCLGVTGTFSQFAVPITGSASPDPVAAGETLTLSGTSVQIQVAAQLIATGVTTGLVTPSDSLANIGTDLSGLGAPYDAFAPNGAGVNAVSSAVGSVKLTINGTNTSQGSQVAQNPSPVALTFFVVRDAGSGAVEVYTDLSIPPGPTPQPTRTGTLLVGNLPVTIPLADTTWTPTGGEVQFSEVNTVPSNLLTPTVADKNAAPLILLPKINGAINVPFHCWPGTVSSAPPGPNPLIPGSSTVIDTVSVTGGSSTSSSSSSSTSSTSSSTTSSTSSTSTTVLTTSTTVKTATSSTGTATFGTTCSNNLTPDKSKFSFSITGTAPSEVNAGDKVTLSKQSWTMAVPGSVLDTGLNLGLLTPGQLVDGTLTASVFGRNTAEGVVTAAPVALKAGPIDVDAVSGLAKPASTTVAIPDMSWTAVGGDVSYVMSTTKLRVTIGALKLDFTCVPDDTSAAVVKTSVIGKTDIPPAAEVLGSTETQATAADALPRTGPQEAVRLIILGLGALDIGYLALSTARPPRRRELR